MTKSELEALLKDGAFEREVFRKIVRDAEPLIEEYGQPPNGGSSLFWES